MSVAVGSQAAADLQCLRRHAEVRTFINFAVVPAEVPGEVVPLGVSGATANLKDRCQAAGHAGFPTRFLTSTVNAVVTATRITLLSAVAGVQNATGFGAGIAPEWDVKRLGVWARPVDKDGVLGEEKLFRGGSDLKSGFERAVRLEEGRVLTSAGLNCMLNDVNGIKATSAKITKTAEAQAVSK